MGKRKEDMDKSMQGVVCREWWEGKNKCLKGKKEPRHGLKSRISPRSDSVH